MIEKVVKVPIVVRFGDTDPYGVVYFVSYFRYCHWGIEEFLRNVGLEPNMIFRNQEEKFGLPVVGARCDFYRPVWYGEKLELHVRLREVRTKVVVFGFEFYRPSEDSMIAKGEATLVAIGSDWKSRELPDLLKKKII